MSEQSETRQPLYLFAGGGTGGHLAPGIAVAEELRREQPDCRIRFVGSGRPVEQQMLEPTEFDYSILETLPLNAANRRPIRFVTSHCKAFRASCRDIDKDRPSAIVGLGGFASVPLALAAKKCKVPCLLLEQNTVPGKANRWLSNWHAICLTFEESARHLPTRAISHLTGNPLRAEIRDLATSDRLLPCEHRNLLVLGGSLGSRQVNDSVLNAVGQLAHELNGWRIMHQTGPNGAEAARRAYSKYGVNHEVAPFFPDLPARLGSASLAIARAGATTLAELSAVGIPAILIPYPAAADDHQTKNAQFFSQADAAIIVASQDRSFSPVDIVAALQPLLSNQPRLQSMSRAMQHCSRLNASTDVVSHLRSLLQ